MRPPLAEAMLILFAATVPAWWPGIAAGQAPTTQPTATVPYVNKAFGFELQVPAGWNYDRSGFFGPGGSLGLLRGTAPDGRTSLQILLFQQVGMRSFPDWIEFFAEQLGTLRGVERVQVRGEPNFERPAAYLIADAEVGWQRTRTLYCCVCFDRQTVWVLSYATVLGDALTPPEEPPTRAVEVPADFARLAESLRVFYDPQLAEQLAAALERGRAYLAERFAAAAAELSIDETVRYYEIRLAGKPIGYLTRQFRLETEPLARPSNRANPKHGIRVRERSWRFADDGSVYFSRVELFSSRDRLTDLYELWEARIPRDGAGDSVATISRDQCVREGNTLVSSYTTSRDRGLPEPRRPLRLQPGYLGLGWVRLLPGLLGPEPGPALAFTIYDPQTRTLIAHAIRPLGETPCPGRAGQRAWAWETREGLVPEVALLYTDERGNLLRLEAGDLVLALSDEATIETRYGRRRRVAEMRLRQALGGP